MQQIIRGDLFRRLLQALFVICVCLASTGCLGPASAADAEQMTYDTATSNKSAAGARSYQILASEPALRGHLVAYHLCEPGQGGQPAESIIGYQLVRNSWLTGEGGRYAERHQPVSGGALEYLTDGGPGSQDDFTLILGRFLDPQATVAEIRFVDGEVIRADAQRAEFLVLRQEPIGLQSLTVLDAQGKILQYIDMTQPLGPPPPSPHPATC